MAAKPKPAASKAGKKGKDNKPAGPGAIAAGGVDAADGEKGEGQENAVQVKQQEPEVVESFTATGIDNALDLLEVVTAKMDKASVGQQAAGIERHPEVRYSSGLCELDFNWPWLLPLDHTYSVDSRCVDRNSLAQLLL